MAKKTYKSSKGTITNVIQNKDGSKTIQVKDKDGKYFENTIKPEISFSEDITNRANNLARQANNSSLGWDINEQEKNGHFIKAGTRPKQSVAGKIGDVIYNPFTAIGHFIRGQKIPDYLQESIDNGTYGYYDQIGRYQTDRSIFDIIADLGPIGYSHAASDILDRMVNKPSDLTSGENVIDVLSVLTPYLKISSSKPRFNLSKSTSNLPALNYQFGIRPASINQFNPSGLTKELLVNAAGYGNFQNGGVFDGGGDVDKKKPKQEIITLDTHDSEYSTVPKIRDAEADPETGVIKSSYDPETGTIYLSPEDLSNNDVIKNFEKQHYGLIEQREKEKKITDRIAALKQKSFIPSSPISDDFTFDFTKDSKVNDDQTKDITGINASVDYNKDGFSIGADASLKNDASRNKILFNLNNQRVGFESGIGDYTFGARADNTFDENSKAAFNPNTSAFIQKNNFRLEGNNYFQKDENGRYTFNPNLTLSYADENKSFSARHEFTKGEDGKWKITPTLSGNVKSGNWNVGQILSSNRDENNNVSDMNSSIEYASPNGRFNAGLNVDYSRFNNDVPEFNSGTFNMSYRQPISKDLNLNISGSNQFEKEDLANPELNLGVNYGGRNNPVSFNVGNTFKEGSLFNPSVGFRYNLENGGTMNEELMQQVQQMIQQGASKGDVAQQLMAAVQEGQLDQESVMQVFQQLGITEQDLQQAQQPSEAQQQVMALGGMRRYPNGGQPSPEEMAMMEQQAQQQGQAQEGQPQGGGDQMQQIMQQVQQMIEQGAQPIDVVQALLQNQIPPEAIMQILTEMGMPPQEAQGLIQEVMQGGQQQPQGPGEEQMEGAASNPQEEAQEIPMQNYGGYVKEVMRKALGGKVTSDVDPGNVAAKRNLEFASVLKRNTHMSMLDNAFGNGVEDKQNNLPRADDGFQTSFKALMEKYKDDPDAKAYLEATKGLREDSEYMANLKTLRETYKDNPELLKTLDQVEKQYKAAKEMQALQQQFSSAYGPGQYYQRNGQYYSNPSAFSRMINNSGWDRSRPNFDISGIPLSNDPNATYYITNKTDKQGMFGRRKVSFDVDWTRGDVAGTDPNKVVDPNKAVTLTPGQQRRANRRLGNNFEDALETATDPIYDDNTLSEADRLSKNYATAYDVIAGNKDYTNQVNPYLGTYLDPAKTLGEDESDISRRDIKNYYEEAFPNLPGRDRRRLARESYRTGEIITGGKNRPDAVAAKYTFRTPEEEATDVKSNTDVNSNVPLNNNGDPLVDNKGALINYDYTPEEPSRRELRQQKRDEKRSLELEEDLKKQEEEKKQQIADKYRENFDNALDESFSTINDNLTESQKLKAKSEKFNNLKSKVGNYKDYENIYQGTYLDPSGLSEDASRGDLKDYYREAFPELSRRDTRRLAREADKSGKILEGGPDGDLYKFKTITPKTETKPERDFNLKQAFGNFANKVGGWFSRGDDSNTTEKAYGGNMWMPRADGGLQMYLKSLGLDEKDSRRLNRKASDADSGSGTFAVKDRFNLDWDATTDFAKEKMDWLSSKFDNLDVQQRMEDPDRFSSINQFAPQSYEQMDRGLYGPQGEFIPNEQGPTTVFNPTDAEGTFYRQLYALGGNVTIDSFTEEELQILKDAGYNIEDLI